MSVVSVWSARSENQVEDWVRVATNEIKTQPKQTDKVRLSLQPLSNGDVVKPDRM